MNRETKAIWADESSSLKQTQGMRWERSLNTLHARYVSAWSAVLETKRFSSLQRVCTAMTASVFTCVWSLFVSFHICTSDIENSAALTGASSTCNPKNIFCGLNIGTETESQYNSLLIWIGQDPSCQISKTGFYSFSTSIQIESQYLALLSSIKLYLTLAIYDGS